MQVSDFPDVAKLSIHDKIELIDLLWDEVAAGPALHKIPDGQKAELDRRRKAYKESPENVLTLEELQTRIEKRR